MWLGKTLCFVPQQAKRHPSEMGAEVTAHLSYLAVEQGVSSSPHQQALSALLFLYREVLGCQLLWLDQLSRPKKSTRLLTVLSKSEVALLFGQIRFKNHHASSTSTMIYCKKITMDDKWRRACAHLDHERMTSAARPTLFRVNLVRLQWTCHHWQPQHHGIL